jgi:hypothetical protein
VLRSNMRCNPLFVGNDSWVYAWGSSYTASKYYKHIHEHIQVIGLYKWIWKSSCIMKHKFFAQLLISDSLNTRDMLKRRHWNVTEDTHCVLCFARAYEDRMHLFFSAISVRKFVHICRLIGCRGKIFKLLLQEQGWGLLSLFSWKW